MKSQDKNLDNLINSVLKSSKYKNIGSDIIKYTGQKELSVRKNFKEAVKHTKNRLHQAGGSFFKGKRDYNIWLENLKKAGNERDKIKTVCIEIMKSHISTEERIPFLENFYKEIFSCLPPVKSILDPGCGLNPLSLFWMPLKEGFSYYAFDIYNDMIDFLNEFMTLYGISGKAEVMDISRFVPEIEVDVAFIFKLLPVLEQIEKGSALKLIDNLKVKYMVITFPVKSLCGKNKNMPENYERIFRELFAMKEWDIKRLDFKTELVFIVSKEN